MSRVFVLGRLRTGQYPLRLAGGLVVDLYGRELRGEDGLALWSPRDRARLQAALEEARRRPEPIVATAEAANDIGAIGLEMLFAPLAGPHGENDRFLGLMQPLAVTARLMGRPVTRLTLRALTLANGEATVPRLRLATLDGHNVA